MTAVKYFGAVKQHHTKERHLPTAKRCCDSYGDAWIWLAFAPAWHLVLAFVVGKRTQESTNLLLERVVHVIDDRVPFFTSDQLAEYRTALLHVYGQWYQGLRQGLRGPHPQPPRVARPDLLYAQVVKERERGQVVAVSSKVVFGDPEIIKQRVVASCVSTAINTSFVERENLALRQRTRRLTRETKRLRARSMVAVPSSKADAIVASVAPASACNRIWA